MGEYFPLMVDALLAEHDRPLGSGRRASAACGVGRRLQDGLGPAAVGEQAVGGFELHHEKEPEMNICERCGSPAVMIDE